MAFSSNSDATQFNLYGGEAAYFDLQLCLPDSARTPESNLSARKFTAIIYSTSDNIVDRYAGILSSGSRGDRFIWKLHGDITAALANRADLKLVIRERMNDATGDIILPPASLTVQDGVPSVEDNDDAPYARYITHLRRVGSPATSNMHFEVDVEEYSEASTGPTCTSLPVITGTAKVGNTLTVSTGLWTDNPASYAYQWYRGGSAITGAQNNSYALVSADSGATVSTRVTATNANGSTPVMAASVTVQLQPTLGALSVSPSFITEGSTAGTLVGAITGKTAGSTLTLYYDVGGRFALNNANIIAGATATDYEAATSHVVVVREAHPDATNSPRDSSITIVVGNVFEQPNLSALVLSSTSLQVGVPTSGTISAATVGSSIASSNLPSGFTVNGTARTWAWDGTGAAGTPTITLTESLGDSANAPRVTNIGLTIAAAAGGSAWILAAGVWDDGASWDDAALWKDAA